MKGSRLNQLLPRVNFKSHLFSWTETQTLNQKKISSPNKKYLSQSINILKVIKKIKKNDIKSNLLEFQIILGSHFDIFALEFQTLSIKHVPNEELFYSNAKYKR